MSEIFVRPYETQDLESVKRLFAAQNLDYKLPDFDASQFLVRAVIEEGEEVTAAMFLRKVANAYYFCDPNRGTKREKLGKLFIMRRELTPLAIRSGFDEIEAFLPPHMEKFGKLLVKHFGWKRNLWPCYSVDLEKEAS